jgi:hypothetical protein
MRPTPILRAAALALVSGCGLGGETGAPVDDTDTEDTVPAHLADSYDHSAEMHIVPNETGVLFGLTECDLILGATLSVDPQGAACPACDALYSGPILSTWTDCSGVSTDSDVLSYGMAMEGGAIRVWTFDDETSVWTDEGLATAQGVDLYQLVTTEVMGDESFSIGDMTVTYFFTAL